MYKTNNPLKFVEMEMWSQKDGTLEGFWGKTSDGKEHYSVASMDGFPMFSGFTEIAKTKNGVLFFDKDKFRYHRENFLYNKKGKITKVTKISYFYNNGEEHQFKKK